MQNLKNYINRNVWKQDWNETKLDAEKGLETLVSLVKKPYRLYRDNKYVNLNANILTAAYPSIQAAVCASSVMSSRGYCDGAIATGAALVDWAAYIPVHMTLHYLSKRHKFKDETGKLNKKEFWKDIGKVYLTQIPSIALFYILATPLQYGLMKAGFEADSANLLSYWGTLVATRSLHTYNYWNLQRRVKRTRSVSV